MQNQIETIETVQKQSVEYIEADLNGIESDKEAIELVEIFENSSESEREVIETNQNEPIAAMENKNTEQRTIVDINSDLPEPQKGILELDFDQLKIASYKGYKEPFGIRYHIAEQGECLVCANDLYTAIFGKIVKFGQMAQLEKMGIDAVFGKEYFFSLSKCYQKVAIFNLAANRYAEKPENYDRYVHFILNDGMNEVAKLMGLMPKFAVYKPLAHLGINQSDFIVQKLQATQQQQPAPTIEKNESVENVDSMPPPPPQSPIESAQLAEIKEQIEVLAKEGSENSKHLNDVLTAFETISKNTDANFKAFQQNLKQVSDTLSDSFAELVKSNAALKTDLSQLKEVQQQQAAQIESAKIEAEKQAQKQIEISQQVAPIESEDQSRLQKLLVSKRVWTYLAICVTLVFLPFTVMGLLKHIDMPMDWWLPKLAVPILCIAIAFVWDMAIFFFAVNGKSSMALFGSMVQVVFFSAKFNLISILITDIVGGNGEWWQNLIVIIAAVVYSPLLLKNITDLVVSQKTENQAK